MNYEYMHVYTLGENAREHVRAIRVRSCAMHALPTPPLLPPLKIPAAEKSTPPSLEGFALCDGADADDDDAHPRPQPRHTLTRDDVRRFR